MSDEDEIIIFVIIFVKIIEPTLKCRCGSNKCFLLGNGLADWDKREVEETTFIHLICRGCGKTSGLIGENKKDWVIEKMRCQKI